MPVRKAGAEWKGDLITGKGTLHSTTGAIQGQYNFSSRFEEGTGTNPEELLAAAHAGCFAMALSAGLAKSGFIPDAVLVNDDVYIEKKDGGFTITKIVIHCSAAVKGISEEQFFQIAEETKVGCPVSRALAGVQFELDVRLQ